MNLRDLRELNEPSVKKIDLGIEDLLEALENGVDTDFLVNVGFDPKDVEGLDMEEVKEALTELAEVYRELKEVFTRLLETHYTDNVIMATISSVKEMLDSVEEEDPELAKTLAQQIKLVLNDK